MPRVVGEPATRAATANRRCRTETDESEFDPAIAVADLDDRLVVDRCRLGAEDELSQTAILDEVAEVEVAPGTREVVERVPRFQLSRGAFPGVSPHGTTSHQPSP